MDGDYEPDEADMMCDYGDGNCPFCGARLRYRELDEVDDIGCDYCPDCGYEDDVT